tara:strand:- start:4217 stop:6031 length:1815 start_codon:yes stop_codon:yes gene_type:complete
MSNFIRLVGGMSKRASEIKAEDRKAKKEEERLMRIKMLEKGLDRLDNGFNIGGSFDYDTGQFTGGITIGQDIRTQKNKDVRFQSAVDYFSQINAKSDNWKQNYLADPANAQYYSIAELALQQGVLDYNKVDEETYRQMDISFLKGVIPDDVYQNLQKRRGESDAPQRGEAGRLIRLGVTDNNKNKKVNNTPIPDPNNTDGISFLGTEIFAGTPKEEAPEVVNPQNVDQNFLDLTDAYLLDDKAGFDDTDRENSFYKLGEGAITRIEQGQGDRVIKHFASSLEIDTPAENVGGMNIPAKPIEDPDEFIKQRDFHRARYIAGRTIYSTIDDIFANVIGRYDSEGNFVPGLMLGTGGLQWQNIKDNYLSKEGGAFDQIARLLGKTDDLDFFYDAVRNRNIGSSERGGGTVDLQEQTDKYGMGVNEALNEIRNQGRAASVQAQLIGLAFQVAIANQDYQGGKAVSDADFDRAWKQITGSGNVSGSLFTGFTSPHVLMKTLRTVRDGLSQNTFESYVISQDIVGENNKGTELRTANKLSKVIVKTARTNNLSAPKIFNRILFGEDVFTLYDSDKSFTDILKQYDDVEIKTLKLQNTSSAWGTSTNPYPN